jgi:hypothetical protein
VVFNEHHTLIPEVINEVFLSLAGCNRQAGDFINLLAEAGMQMVVVEEADINENKCILKGLALYIKKED